MNKRLTILALALITVLAGPAAYGCSQEPVPGPALCSELLYDVHFAQNCPYWNFSGGGAVRYVAGGASYGDLRPLGGYIEQAITVIPGPYGGNIVEMGFNVEMLGSAPGTERLKVEIRTTGGSLIDTVDIIAPSEGSGRYNYQLSPSLVGQTVLLRFRYTKNSAPGDTTFRLRYVQFWTCG